MKKKVISGILTGAMLLSLLAGCGSKGAGASGTTTEGGSAASGDPAHIVVESLYFDATPADLQAVQDAINEITIPEINVEVELYPISFATAASDVSRMISSGEQLDLAVNLSVTDFNTLVDNNMLLELDDLYAEYGSDIADYASFTINGGYSDGVLYGIPSIEKYGRTFGLIVESEVADAAGGVEEGKIYTQEELGEALAQMHEAYPDKTLIQCVGGGDAVLTYFDYFNVVDYLGADIACGGVLNNSGEVVNVFASDEYAEFCENMHAWYEAGYINSDALTYTDTSQGAVTAGTAVGYLLNTELDMVPGQSSANGVDMVAYNTRGQFLTMSDVNGANWCIPYTCENPEAAMQLLNLMYKDTELIDLIYYGIEGQDYQVVGEEYGHNVLDYVDGQTAQDCGYHQWFGLYGGVSLRSFWQQGYDIDTYNANITDENTSIYMGYTYTPSDDVQAQYTAVNNVIKKYRNALETGNADPSTTLPQFLSDLEDAGINDIIAENQEQLNTYLENSK